MATDVLEFNGVALLSRGVLNGGHLKLHKGGAIFKSAKTGIVDQFSGSDIVSTQWMQVAWGYELKITLRKETQFKFDGFKESETMLLYGQQPGSGEDSEVDKETVESLSNNVLSLTSLVNAQSEVIENLSREVAGLRETMNSKKKEGEENVKNAGRMMSNVERKLQITTVSITSLKTEFFKVQEETEKIKKVVKKMLHKIEGKVEEENQVLDSRLKRVEKHVDSLYNLQKNTTEITKTNEWPEGKYCILASGQCPLGFRRFQGYLKSLYLYSQHEQFLKEAAFGSSYIGCFGKYCGEYGNFIGSFRIVSCCK